MSKKLREAVVERAAQLIEKGWCRGALARDGEGNKVGVYSDDAVAYCVVGALMCATRGVVGATETTAATAMRLHRLTPRHSPSARRPGAL